MILYLDSSALVKRYIAEVGSEDVNDWIGQADLVSTCLVSRAEVSAAIARSSKLLVLSPDDALRAVNAFRAEWEDFLRLPVTETLIKQADILAWEYGLRGYDSIHLAAALLWKDAIGEPIVLATYDRQLWAAASRAGLVVKPETLK